MNTQYAISDKKCYTQSRITLHRRFITYLKEIHQKRQQRKARSKTLRELKKLDAHILNDIGVDHRTLMIKQDPKDV